MSWSSSKLEWWAFGPTLFALLKLVFIGKNQRGEIPGRLGEQSSPNWHNKAAKTRLGSRFRGPGVARWPHPVGWLSCFGDSPVSSSDFLVSGPGFDETAFDYLASTAWFREDSSQPVFNLSDMPRFALIPWFRIYSELNQNLMGFWACFSFLSFSNWAYI